MKIKSTSYPAGSYQEYIDKAIQEGYVIKADDVNSAFTPAMKTSIAMKISIMEDKYADKYKFTKIPITKIPFPDGINSAFYPAENSKDSNKIDSLKQEVYVKELSPKVIPKLSPVTIDFLNANGTKNMSNTEIQYFGNTKFKTALGQAYSALTGNSGLNKSNLYNPFAISLCKSDWKINSTHKWPIVAKGLYSDDEKQYCLPTEISDKKSFSDFCESFFDSDPDGEVLITRPLLQEHAGDTSYSSKFFFYLASDYLMVHGVSNDDSYVIDGNFENIFKSSGLDKSKVYRLVSTGAKFFINMIFKADDVRLSCIKSLKVDSLFENAEIKLSVINGYRNGFNYLNLVGTKTIPVQKVFTTDSYNFGFTLGLGVASFLTKELARVEKEFVAAKIDTLESAFNVLNSLSTNPQRAELGVVVNMHNTLCSPAKECNDINVINKYISLFANKDYNLASLLVTSGSIRDFLYRKMEDPKTKAKNSFSKKINISEETFSIEKSVSITSAQYRICDYGHDHIRVRFQALKMTQAISIITGDKIDKIDGKPSSKSEHDFNITSADFGGDTALFSQYKNELIADNFCINSQHGTAQKYAGLTLNSLNELFSVALNKVVFSTAQVENHILKSCLPQQAFASELIAKLSKTK